ncbi:pyrroline-5-carboxylate reductase [Dysgonomonas sp. 520]|uniref:pyrroline-5-carboxylate reductase n=1 Tax=Dysgonomonas sp. 520 TaxID=2302931 RepID=UPI0013CF6DE3|nr:pyrroline-5-carboxylate reductase [Dysgonomonas sp. 520]NDW09186.1 pyrroline-5-carboxylate reductase [Dysgonomonas sp. 520]
MKISIIGGGNMGSSIACGLASGSVLKPSEITVVDQDQQVVENIGKLNKDINVAIKDYSSISNADVVIIAVKPWLVETVLKANHDKFDFSKQLIISLAPGITLMQLQSLTSVEAKLYRIIPNTAVAVRQSMTFICQDNTTAEEDKIVRGFFEKLGKVEFIKEFMIPAVTALSSCGIAYAFRYIRASMEGGIELGISANQSKDIVLQTLRGAIELLEANGSHPEAEIDKVTTPGGITIKGLNEMEQAGFSSAVIRGLKASNVK